MRVALSILMMTMAAPLAAAQSTPTYKNSSAHVDGRIADLLQRMTIEEKVAQLEGDDSLPSFVPVPGVFDGANINPQIAKTHLGNGIGIYAFVADFAGEAGTPQEAARKRNLLQKWVLENTRLGIPVLFHGEALHGGVFRGATTFPEVVGLGSTWDPDLIHTMFDAVARESRAIGNAMVLAPVLDLSRDPLCRLATRTVRSLHFASYNTNDAIAEAFTRIGAERAQYYKLRDNEGAQDLTGPKSCTPRSLISVLK